MKERPIIFSAPMVRAIQEGRKTQTRRVVKPQPSEKGEDELNPGDVVFQISTERKLMKLKESRGEGMRRAGLLNGYNYNCPYGRTGDRLWVREAWSVGYEYDHLPPKSILKTSRIQYEAGPLFFEPHNRGKTRPSIFMPRWASRITLEIAGVRVERLQDISESDAEAEGCEGWYDPLVEGCTDGRNPSDVFQELWDSINGKKHPWESNPWVWAIEFKKLDGDN